MFGNERDAHLGQLALLDAIVFFVVAISISSMMFYYADVGEVEHTAANPDGQSDPDAILKVFLHASLGSEVLLQLDGGKRISAGSEVAECIQIELEALASGANTSSFVPLNHRLVTILNATCSALLNPYIAASWLHDGARETLLSIPDEPPRSNPRYAGSVLLSSKDGSIFVLTITLVPASFSKILDVSTGNLDLGLRVRQSPADLQP